MIISLKNSLAVAARCLVRCPLSPELVGWTATVLDLSVYDRRTHMRRIGTHDVADCWRIRLTYDPLRLLLHEHHLIHGVLHHFLNVWECFVGLVLSRGLDGLHDAVQIVNGCLRLIDQNV